jgi:GIY-YIG catalytic domain-containing protein
MGGPRDTSKPCYLYRVTHTDSGRDYVGISVNPRHRWKQHLYDAAKSTFYFHRMLAKYGESAFTWEIIAKSSWDGARLLEKWAIALGMGKLNLTKGGDGLSGVAHSPETCEKIGASHRGRKHSPEFCAMRSRVAKQVWAELKEDAARLNSVLSHMSGRTITEATLLKKQAIAAAQKGTPLAKQRVVNSWITRKANAAAKKSVG